MVASARRRVRFLSCAPALALTLAACSSSGTAELSATPAVTPNAKHYSYDSGSVAASSWPKACSLLSVESAAAAIGTAVTTTRFHTRCFYSPTNDTFPTLTVTILGIGHSQRGTYNTVRDSNARYKPTRVRGVGKAAVTYAVSGSPTVNLDLLADEGVFEIALRSPVGNRTGAATARAILVRVGRALASEFAG